MWINSDFCGLTTWTFSSVRFHGIALKSLTNPGSETGPSLLFPKHIISVFLSIFVLLTSRRRKKPKRNKERLVRQWLFF